MVDMQKILNYLTDLENNNNREWYHAHKKEKAEADKEFEKLIEIFIDRIREFDSNILPFEPKELTFKLVRDTRFSKDDTPYNPTFRAHISAKGKLPIPVGYFISIKPHDDTFLGGGLFADIWNQATSMIRDHISSHPNELEKIINNKEFKQNFTIMGTQLKNVPKGYDPENKMAEYLKNKSWYLEYPVNDKDLLDSENFINMAVEKFKLMLPFNSYLNEALKDFVMPSRPTK